jgi:hypothetical protein
MVPRTRSTAAIAILLIALALSVGLNARGLFQGQEVIGVADSKAIGRGVDSNGNETVWYTVSLSLVTRDDEHGIPIGGTLAYVIDKADFDRIRDGAVIRGRLTGRVGLEIAELNHAETFELGDSRFYCSGECVDPVDGV